MDYIREDYVVVKTEQGYEIVSHLGEPFTVYYAHTASGFSSDNTLGHFDGPVAEVTDPLAGTRCYFHLVAESGRYSVAATRGVAIAGINNLREIGMYNTADGVYFVKPGAIYRSGALNRADEAGRHALTELGLKFALDFRSDKECARGAHDPQLTGCEMVRLSALEFDGGEEGEFDLSRFLSLPLAQRQKEMEGVQGGYKIMPFNSRAYTELFARLSRGELPMLFHCAAGKDRTGIAAALILLALGVPREVAVYDYMLTDDFCREILESIIVEHKVETPEALEVLQVIMSVKKENIESALAAVFEKYDTIESYLAAELAVTAEDLKNIKKHCLVKH